MTIYAYFGSFIVSLVSFTNGIYYLHVVLDNILQLYMMRTIKNIFLQNEKLA
jgi:hypothetical protein